jgi:general secretion pathway protein A
MYNEFFGFSEEPFRLTPDPSFFFTGMSHGEALSSLRSGIREKKGIITVTGDVGTGKTTLIYALLKDLSDNVKTAFISNPRLPFKQLLKAVLWDLKVPVIGNSTFSLLHKFDLYLQERSADHETVVIIIDEAQNLSGKVLEDLDRLFQKESPGVNFLLTLLVGQLELEANLDSAELRQLKQRITLQRRLSPLNWEESKAYIDHRLKIVGSSISKVFTPEAVDLICEFAKGIPRVVNKICDQALFAGYSSSMRRIDAMTAKAVIREEEDTTQEEILEEGETTVEKDSFGMINYPMPQEPVRFLEEDFLGLRGESMKKKDTMGMDRDRKGSEPLPTSEPKEKSYWLYSGSFLGLYKSLKEKYIDLEVAKNQLQKEYTELAAQIAKKEAKLKEVQESLRMEGEKRRHAEEILGPMEERVRYLSSEFLDHQEKDKKFIAEDLLDVITSLILSLKGGAKDILHIMKGESNAALFNFEQILCNLQNGIQKTEEIMAWLYPPTLDAPGILPTIDWYCRKFQKYHTQFQISQEIDVQEDEISAPLKRQVFRILQEALDIMAEYGRGDRIGVSIMKKDEKVHLTVEENGQGFDLQKLFSNSKGIRLTRIKQRTELSGGSFSIESAEAFGMVIRSSWSI